MLIEWKENYSIGVARIDEQHRQLIGMLNELYRNIGEGVDPAKVWPLLAGFNHYAETHFSCEDRLARANAIPQEDYAPHRAEHDAYRERMLNFHEDLGKGDRYAAIQLLSFLTNWWLSHILIVDVELGKQLNARKVN